MSVNSPYSTKRELARKVENGTNGCLTQSHLTPLSKPLLNARVTMAA